MDEDEYLEVKSAACSCRTRQAASIPAVAERARLVALRRAPPLGGSRPEAYADRRMLGVGRSETGRRRARGGFW